jgi:hypothetical protein
MAYPLHVFPFAVLGFELRASCLLDSALLLVSHALSPPFFHFNYFSASVSRFFLGLALDCDPPTYTSCITGITNVGLHACSPSLLLRVLSTFLLCRIFFRVAWRLCFPEVVWIIQRMEVDTSKRIHYLVGMTDRSQGWGNV